MNENAPPLPRWGNKGRDRKALAIMQTLVHHCGEGIKTGTWIDVGCGSGGIVATLAPHVTSIVGVDPEPWPTWGDAETAHPNLSFQMAAFDQNELPVLEESADVIVCNQVYEHVKNPQVLIRNIHRALKPGGSCYFAGPNLLWPIEPHVNWPIVHWLPRATAHRVMAAIGSKRGSELDAFSTTCWRLLRWFGDAGYACNDAVLTRLAVELDMGGLRAFAGLVRSFPPTLFKLVMPFSPGFVFILRKPCITGRCRA